MRLARPLRPLCDGDHKECAFCRELSWVGRRSIAVSVPGVDPTRAGCRAVRTARSRRGILAFTHLAREGRMTVTIGRRELLAALGARAAVRYAGDRIAT